VTTLGGGGATGCERGYRDGPLAEALFDTPTGLACAVSSPWLFVCDTGNHAIRRIHLVKCALGWQQSGLFGRFILIFTGLFEFWWWVWNSHIFFMLLLGFPHLMHDFFSFGSPPHPTYTPVFGSDGRHLCRQLGVRSSRRHGRGGHL
jgi:hypothetical protein